MDRLRGPSSDRELVRQLDALTCPRTPSRDLAHALSRLDPDSAAALLHDGVGWPVEEIARRTGSTADRVREGIVRRRLEFADAPGEACTPGRERELLHRSLEVLDHLRTCSRCRDVDRLLRAGRREIRALWRATAPAPPEPEPVAPAPPAVELVLDLPDPEPVTVEVEVPESVAVGSVPEPVAVEVETPEPEPEPVEVPDPELVAAEVDAPEPDPEPVAVEVEAPEPDPKPVAAEVETPEPDPESVTVEVEPSAPEAAAPSSAPPEGPPPAPEQGPSPSRPPTVRGPRRPDPRPRRRGPVTAFLGALVVALVGTASVLQQPATDVVLLAPGHEQAAPADPSEVPSHPPATPSADAETADLPSAHPTVARDDVGPRAWQPRPTPGPVEFRAAAGSTPVPQTEPPVDDRASAPTPADQTEGDPTPAVASTADPTPAVAAPAAVPPAGATPPPAPPGTPEPETPQVRPGTPTPEPPQPPTPEPAPPPPPPTRPDVATWHAVAHCESGGNWTANTGNGYYGGLQFSLSSWRLVGGAGMPHEASVDEQIMRAGLLWDIQGWNAWPVCSRRLGLR